MPEMYKYRTQHLRGTAQEWSEVGDIVIPLDGEIVIEKDDSGNHLHRLKIGDGVTPYGQLPYLSVDNFVMTKQKYVTLHADRWIDDENNALKHYQIVEVANALITNNSKVDLQIDSEQVIIFSEKRLSFVAENENGVITVVCTGQRPTADYTIQVMVTEVMLDG